MKIKVLSPAMKDLYEGRKFYEKQREGLGEYFFDSLSTTPISLNKMCDIGRVIKIPRNSLKRPDEDTRPFQAIGFLVNLLVTQRFDDINI